MAGPSRWCWPCRPKQEEGHPPGAQVALTWPPTSSSPEKSDTRGLLWLRRVRLRCRPRSGSGERASWQWERSRSPLWPRVCSPETERAWNERGGCQRSGNHRGSSFLSPPCPGLVQTTWAVARAYRVSLLPVQPIVPPPLGSQTDPDKRKSDIIPLLKTLCLPVALR